MISRLNRNKCCAENEAQIRSDVMSIPRLGIT